MDNKKEFKNFCRNINRIKQDYNLSDKKLMKIMHIAHKTLKSIKNGVIPERFGVETLFHLNNYFNINVASLFKDKYKINDKQRRKR